MNIKKLLLLILFVLLLGFGCNNNTDDICEHDIESVARKEATCTENGNVEYFYCTKCNKYYADKELTIEKTYEELIINKTNHTESAWIIDTEATCTNQGLKHKECMVCKEKLQEEVIEITNHNFNTSNIVLIDNGNKAVVRYNCSNCTSYKDEAYKGYYLLNDEAYEFDNLGNRIDLNKSFIEVNGNTYYIINNIVQKNTFIVYEQYIYFFDENGKALMNTTYNGYVFSADGYLIGNDILIEINDVLYYVVNNIASVHNHSLGHILYNPATCTADGNIEYFYCTTCNRLYKDNECINEITYEDIIIKASHNITKYEGKESTCTEQGYKAYEKCANCSYTTFESLPLKEHTLTDWIIDTESTCTQTGSKHKECSACKNVIETEVIERKEHNYVDGFCTNCKTKEPSEGLKYTLINDEYYEVTDIGTCTDTDLVIPSTYNGKPVTSIGENAFRFCSSLTSITIPDSVTSIWDGAFWDCSKLTSIILSNSVTSIGNSVFSGCSHLTSITIPGSVTSIGSDAFFGCMSLPSITIPDSVTSIGVRTFYYCTSLTSITIPESVTSIGGGAFWDCSKLTSIILPNSVTSIGSSAFSNCSSLTSITIPDSVTSIGSSAFSNCSSLTSITIPDSVTSIGSYAFFGCMSLTSITIPDSVTSIGSYAFSLCSSLTNITIPDGVTSIASCAFKGCSNLTSITIPDNVTSIGSGAFYECSKLTNITIPDGVVSIGNSAFGGCSNLTSITIPDSVTSIERSAFANCYSLAKIYYKGSESGWSNITIEEYNSDLTAATRYYYSESEPSLNDDETAYNGNYWHYDTDGKIIIEWAK